MLFPIVGNGFDTVIRVSETYSSMKGPKITVEMFVLLGRQIVFVSCYINTLFTRGYQIAVKN